MTMSWGKAEKPPGGSSALLNHTKPYWQRIPSVETLPVPFLPALHVSFLPNTYYYIEVAIHLSTNCTQLKNCYQHQAGKTTLHLCSILFMFCRCRPHVWAFIFGIHPFPTGHLHIQGAYSSMGWRTVICLPRECSWRTKRRPYNVPEKRDKKNQDFK